jgi:hypothetical protein
MSLLRAGRKGHAATAPSSMMKSRRLVDGSGHASAAPPSERDELPPFN